MIEQKHANLFTEESTLERAIMVTATGFEGKEQEIAEIRKEYRLFYRLLRGLILVFIGFLIGWVWFSENRGDFLLSLFTNVLAISFGVFVLDERAKQREEARLRADLIFRMGSHVNHEAIRATEEIKRHGWLTDGSMEKVNLETANLRGAILEKARLRQTNLNNAKLQKVTLNYADLRDAWLLGAYLQDSSLHGANLENAHLEMADLRKTMLSYANLRHAQLTAAKLQSTSLEGSNAKEANFHFAQFASNPMWYVDLEAADLSFAVLHRNAMNYANLRSVNFHRTQLLGVWLNDADLQGAKNLEHAIFDEATFLPNGMNWTPETDMEQFTDPNHPKFWRSIDPKSPAYRADKAE
jgi:uncharacterized protein YjbI with pentapeptide repeats